MFLQDRRGGSPYGFNPVRACRSFDSYATAETRPDLARLCQSCGLCCDGSLFGRVVLQSDEIERARKHRLRVLARGDGFEQPCPALGTPGAVGERRCTIYRERPRSCRQFTCKLYERQRAEGGPIEASLAAVKRIRDLVGALESAGLTPADFEDNAATGSAAVLFAELTDRLEEDFARAG